jgi:hypothetical protein
MIETAAMTIEERFDRIEHFRAGIAEERRKEGDGYRTPDRIGASVSAIQHVSTWPVGQ